MTEYPEKLNEFLDSLKLFSSKNDRINYLIEYAEKFQKVPKEVAVPPYPNKNRVEFCESDAYVWVNKNSDDTYKFYFAVENPNGLSARALAAILDETISGETAEKIMKISPDIVQQIFGGTLSMGKNMGLTGIIKMIQHQIINDVQKSKAS